MSYSEDEKLNATAPSEREAPRIAEIIGEFPDGMREVLAILRVHDTDAGRIINVALRRPASSERERALQQQWRLDSAAKRDEIVRLEERERALERALRPLAEADPEGGPPPQEWIDAARAALSKGGDGTGEKGPEVPGRSSPTVTSPASAPAQGPGAGEHPASLREQGFMVCPMCARGLDGGGSDACFKKHLRFERELDEGGGLKASRPSGLGVVPARGDAGCDAGPPSSSSAPRRSWQMRLQAEVTERLAQLELDLAQARAELERQRSHFSDVIDANEASIAEANALVAAREEERDAARSEVERLKGELAKHGS